MPQLGLTLCFLDSVFHGQREGGEPEWPPSPLRVFQALVAAAGARSRSTQLDPASAAALRWLERLSPPSIVAPRGLVGRPHRLAVPNNDLDVLASAWARRKEPTKQANALKTLKTVRPVRLLDGNEVHWHWPIGTELTPEARSYAATLQALTKDVVFLGWGVDMVVGRAEISPDTETDVAPGELWKPNSTGAEEGLRVPVDGTLDELIGRHRAFLERLNEGAFASPPPLTAYTSVAYGRAIDPPRRGVAAFSLIALDGARLQPFDTARRALTVVGMTRRATKSAAESAGREKSWINSFILGHGEMAKGDEHTAVGPRRFAYLPLPSIEPRGDGNREAVGSVRRVLLTTFSEDCEPEVAWARRVLSGRELLREPDASPAALLSRIPGSDRVVQRYVRRADAWVTVTPVVLPGHDDPAQWRRRLARTPAATEQKALLRRLDERIEGLLRKAIVQAGYSQVLAQSAELDWRIAGFLPGVELATRYGVPDHLAAFRRLHVRLRWRDDRGNPIEIPGPVCLGGGRFYGLGLFVPVSEPSQLRQRATRPVPRREEPDAGTPRAPGVTASNAFWDFD